MDFTHLDKHCENQHKHSKSSIYKPGQIHSISMKTINQNHCYNMHRDCGSIIVFFHQNILCFYPFELYSGTKELRHFFVFNPLTKEGTHALVYAFLFG